ncbi:alpha/beta fold hydrolase [Heyndrickxia acidiproducens]|uniref:alpha/beta fold hydrolase n=1 Tax=Heyndrickxia acidiproducens TaxID=1121084 RepID=UPI0003700CE1|nr:alpha/beta hydrolase [Heyndrickxia acidiproducens]
MTDAHDAACYYRSYLDYRCRHKLQDIEQPVLLIYGEKDTLFKKYGPRLASQLPNCRLAHIEKARHYIPGKRDEALSGLIRWFIGS